MPFYSLRDQGFDMPFEALGRGLMAWREKQQRDKENARAEAGLKLQQDQAAFNQGAENRRLGLQEARNTFDQSAETQRLGLSKDEFDLRKKIYDTKSRPFDPSSVPPGMQMSKMTMGPDGWSADLRPPPTGGPVQSPIVELPLPGGGKGMFMTHVDPETGITKYTPYTPPEPAGQKPLDVDAIRKLETLDLIDMQLPKYEQLLESTKGSGGPIAGNLTRPAAPWNMDRNEFNRLQTSLFAPVAKGLFNETGVLSEADQKRYSSIFPQYTDTYEARTNKLAALKELASKARHSTFSTLSSAGRDTSGFTPPSVNPNVERDFSGGVDIEGEMLKALAAGVPLSEIQRRMAEMNTP